jgi:bacterioferritin (cytochrome b1)
MQGDKKIIQLLNVQLELVEKVGLQNYLQPQMEGGPGS